MPGACVPANACGWAARSSRQDALLHPSGTYQYNSIGNLAVFIGRKSQMSSYNYDGLDRLTQVYYNMDQSTLTYTYDGGNRLSQVVDSISGTITREYDGLDRLTSETTPQGSVYLRQRKPARD